jgi:CheY-like chemotaxis protein
MPAQADAADVLIVDDDRDIREALAELLELEGYRTSTAADGADALAQLRGAARPPRLILLDLMMPRMGGAEFLAERRHDPALAAIPVAVLTAARTEVVPVDAAAPLLLKPIDLPALFALVARHCA